MKNFWETAYYMVATIVIIFSFVLFFILGENTPKFFPEHIVDVYNIHENWKLIHIILKVKNTGKVPFDMSVPAMRLQKIMPLESSLKNKLDAKKLIEPGKDRVVWPSLGPDREIYPDDSKVYPGTERSMDTEFFAHTSFEAIRIYRYIKVEYINTGRLF